LYRAHSSSRDRTNFGNAKIAGMEKDLKMKGFDYNIAASVFYITVRALLPTCTLN
jgi:hypothetical protein